MNQKERRLVMKAGFNDQIHFVPLALRYIREHLFVQKLRRATVQISDQVRQEQFQKLDEECREQLFEQSVMVHRVTPSTGVHPAQIVPLGNTAANTPPQLSALRRQNLKPKT